jgi:hypothetical protein
MVKSKSIFVHAYFFTLFLMTALLLLFIFIIFMGVGLRRVVREVHQHPDDHEFESHPSGGSELTFRSDLLLTARDGST